MKYTNAVQAVVICSFFLAGQYKFFLSCLDTDETLVNVKKINK